MKDLIIIGGSAAGAAGAVYAARRKLDFQLISDDWGGEVAKSGEVCNWPGTISTDGFTLAESFRKHLESYGVSPELGVMVKSISKNPSGHFVIETEKGAEQKKYEAKAVVVATGVHPRKLNVPGAAELEGKGLTYCTVCDGPLYKGKKVVTIGGGNSGLESALMLSAIATQVTIITIDDHFSGEQTLIDKLLQVPNVQAVYNGQTTQILGQQRVSGVKYLDKKTGQEKEIAADGVFVHIGLIPNSAFLPHEVRKNKFGEVEVDAHDATNVAGLFAAGDVTNIPYKQIVVAAGQGVVATLAAIEYLNKLPQ